MRELLRDRTAIQLALVALLLNLVGSWWGVPHMTNASAPPHGWEMDTTAGLGTLSELHNLFYPKPDWYVAYPLLHYLVQGAAYAPYLLFLLLTGQVQNPTGTFPYGLQNPAVVIGNLVLISRIITVLMSCGVIVAIYWVGRKVWDRTTALLAAVAMLLCPLFQYYSRTSNLDVPVLFWTLLGLAGVASASKDGLTVPRAGWIGVMAAMAVATKDQAYAAWVSGLVALMVIHWQRTSSSPLPKRDVFWKPVLVLGLSGAACYAVVSGLVFWPKRFFAHLAFVRDFDKTFFNVVYLDLMRPNSLSGYLQLLYDIGDCLLEATGPVLLLLAVVGCALTWKQLPFTRILVLMMVGHLVLTIFPIRHMMFRYVLFVAAGLFLLAARTLVLLWRMRQGTWLGVGLLSAAAYGWLLIFGAEVAYQMLMDARYKAGEWIAGNFKPGDKVGYYGSPDQLPHIPEWVEARRAPLPASLPADWLQTNQFDWLFVIPDFSSRSNGAAAPFRDTGLPRSRFLPESTYQQIVDGSLGYREVAKFETRSLTGRPLKFLPWINPPVTIYQRYSPADPKMLGVKPTEWERRGDPVPEEAGGGL